MAHEGERSDRRSRQDGQEIRWKKKVPIKHFPSLWYLLETGGGVFVISYKTFDIY